jgi:hypothetical protein
MSMLRILQLLNQRVLCLLHLQLFPIRLLSDDAILKSLGDTSPTMFYIEARARYLQTATVSTTLN